MNRGTTPFRATKDIVLVVLRDRVLFGRLLFGKFFAGAGPWRCGCRSKFFCALRVLGDRTIDSYDTGNLRTRP